VEDGRLFPGSHAQPALRERPARTPHDMRHSEDLDFNNATKADLDQNVSYSASVDSLSRQHLFPFQFLELPRAIGSHNEDRVAVRCLPDRRNPV
jgi:hypothetical protein